MPYNVVTFWPESGDNGARRIALTLDRPWRFGAGLKADTNTAVVPYTEFDKLGGRAQGRTGIIEFWYSGLPAELGGTFGRPDVELVGWTIAEAQGTVEGQTPTQGVRYVEYRLSFQDARWRFASPRGGRLVLGHINAGNAPAAPTGGALGPPAPGTAAPSTNPDPAFAGVPEMTFTQLVQACLSAMPNSITIAPNAIDPAIAAPREIKWFGAHAPTELDKLLGLAGLTYAPQADMSGQIVRITNTGAPRVTPVLAPDPAHPALALTPLPQLPLPAVDHRGKTILFSSYPYPIIETITKTGPDDAGWYFVAQDLDGTWLNYHDLFGDGGAIKAWHTDCADQPDEMRRKLQAQLYTYIRLDDGTAPPSGTGGGTGTLADALAPAGVSPVLTRRVMPNGTLSDIELTANSLIADHDHAGQFIAGSNVKVPVLEALAGNILHVSSPLLTVSGPTHDYIADAREPKSGDFSVTFTRSLSEQASDGSWRPKFLHLGFSLDQFGNAVQMPDDQVQTIVSGGTGAAAGLQDVIVIPRPDFRARMVNGAFVNLDQITAAALKLAGAHLANSTNPTQIYQYRGFVTCALDGLVSEIQWDQDRVMTTIVANSWYRPAGSLDVAGLGREEREAAKDEFPHQSKTQDSRTALGELGATRPVMPVGTGASGLPPMTQPWLVKIGARAAGDSNGFYPGTLYLGSLGADGTADLQMPESMIAGKTCLVANLDESMDQPNASGTLAANSWAAVISLERTPNTATDGTDNSQPLAVIRGGVGDSSFVSPADPPGTQLTADASSWTRGQDPGAGSTGTGDVIYLATRIFVDPATKEVGMFQRKFTFDGRGMLVSRGAEEKTVLDTGVSCS